MAPTCTSVKSVATLISVAALASVTFAGIARNELAVEASTPMQVPSPTRPGPDPCDPPCPSGKLCVNDRCVGAGELRFTLVWDRPGDLDLRIVTPAGRVIDYAARAVDGGELDRDDSIGTGPENIHWPSQPAAGSYLVCVGARAIATPTRFTLTIAQSGEPTRVFTGSRESGEDGSCSRSSPSFATEWVVGARAEWGAPIASNPFVWVAGTGGVVPPGAIPGGREANGQPVYICRGPHRGGSHVGKLVGASCTIGWDGAEIAIASYDVLVGAGGRWLSPTPGQLPSDAVAGGNEANGRPLYVCRAEHRRGVHVGSLASGRCSFGWDGEEVAATSYEVLVP